MRPHFYGGGKHDDNPAAKGLRGLTEIRAHQWLDFSFVNLDGQAEPFEDWMRPILNGLATYDFNKLTYVRTIEYDPESNWKLVLGNFWDTYHIPTCHPALEQQTKMADRTNAVTEGKIIFGGYQHPVDDADGKVDRASPIPGHDRDRDYTRNRNWFICCCPPNMIQVWEDAATQDRYACGRDQVIGFMDGFRVEDMDILRWMQQGRNSAACDGGELSDYRDPQVFTFGRMITDGIQETRS
ncbi:MAG: RHO alpha subunit C-terminal catalytic domain-containing protein [bacterium]|nr:RHO alpha subunit C-terminal catalytic domain-containing protein [bacterium]